MAILAGRMVYECYFIRWAECACTAVIVA